MYGLFFRGFSVVFVVLSTQVLYLVGGYGACLCLCLCLCLVWSADLFSKSSKLLVSALASFDFSEQISVSNELAGSYLLSIALGKGACHSSKIVS